MAQWLVLRLAHRFEVNPRRPSGIAGDQLAIDNREFHDVDRRGASPQWRRAGRLRGLRYRPGIGWPKGLPTTKIEPPRAAPADHDIAVRPDESLVLRRPVQAVIRHPHAHSRGPGIGDEPVLSLPMNHLRPLAVAVGNGVAFGLPMEEVRAVRIGKRLRLTL